jgi:homeodomain-containing protein
MERLSGSGPVVIEHREAWRHATEVQMQEQRRKSAGTPAASSEKATESLAAEQRLTWTVPEVARLLGISKDSAYEAAHRGELPVRDGGLDALADRSHRPQSCPHQLPEAVEAVIYQLRRAHPIWGPRRLAHELARCGITPVPSRASI